MPPDGRSLLDVLPRGSHASPCRLQPPAVALGERRFGEDM